MLSLCMVAFSTCMDTKSMVHVMDLTQLECECPTVWNQFLKGYFVTQKTLHKFFMVAHDQIHEQLNAIVKDDGVIGITENESLCNAE